jgi:hypothetical protein
MKPSIELTHSAPVDVINAEKEDIKLLTFKPSSVLPNRRYTDITPASRTYLSSLYPPTSPKIHELLEKCGAKPATGDKKN